MDNTFNWELSKENIQPLRQGRNASQLLSALDEDHTRHAERNEQRKAFEGAIMSYDGQDPLDGWSRYIRWIDEAYPQGGSESGLLTVLEKCLEKVRGCHIYREDPRLLEVYLRYLDLTESSAESFQMLYAGGYFQKLATFYVTWADQLEQTRNFKEATKVFQLGERNGAQPAAKLDDALKKFQARVADAVMSDLARPPELVAIPAECQRHALGELEAAGADEATRRVAVVRTGTSVRRFQDSHHLLAPTASDAASNRPVAVLTDENGCATGPALVASGRITVPTRSEARKEDVRKAAKWNDVAVFSETPVALPAQPKILVHVDDEVLASARRHQDSAGGASFTSALREKAAAPARLNPLQALSAPLESSKVRFMCHLDKIYVASREFSFEEIRHQCRQKRRAAPVDAADRISAPVRTSALHLTATEEPKVSSVKVSANAEPAAPTPTPTPTASSPLESTEAKAKRPAFDPHQHRKATERFHCDLDALYLTSAGEISVEQLRARHYARRAPKTRKVEEPAQADPPPVVDELALIEAVSRCDIGVQTDLAGLEYDLVLVPRVQQPSPEAIRQPSPEAIRPRSPEATRLLLPSTNSVGDQTGLPSPTVNTRAALTNVKSWFNASVLVEPKPQPMTHCPDPFVLEPPKSIGFAVYQDPSVLEPPKSTGFAVYQDPSILEPPKSTGFAVYQDPSVLEPPKSTGFAVYQDPSVQDPPPKSTGFAVFKDPSILEPPKASAFAVYQDPSGPEPIKPGGFAVFQDAPVPPTDVRPREPLKPRKALELLEAAPPTRVPADEPEVEVQQERPVAVEPLADVVDDVKENVAPCDYVQERCERRLSGVLLPSIDVPFEEAPAEEEATAADSVHRQLFADDETRFYSAPTNDCVDFTLPSSAAFARHLQREAGAGVAQSTPFVSRQPPPVFTDDDVTSVLMRRKPTTPASCEAGEGDAKAVPSANDAGGCGPATATGVKRHRRLSDIGEASHECYSSSSGSSAGTTALAFSRFEAAGRSLRNSECGADGAAAAPGRVLAAAFDPFDAETRRAWLAALAEPVTTVAGYHAVAGRVPWLRAHSSVHLDGRFYAVRAAIGSGAYAKIYEVQVQGGDQGAANDRQVLKVQDANEGLWEFYAAAELRRRLAEHPAACSLVSVDHGYFYDNGSILVCEYLPHGSLLNLVNHYRLKNCSMPEPLAAYLALELLAIVEACHTCRMLHADIKADNVMVAGAPLVAADALDAFEGGWTTAELLRATAAPRCLKLIDFGRAVDLTLVPERTAFLHCFQDDKSPEMRDGKPWTYQLDYYGLATTLFMLLMGVHCRVVHDAGQWRVPPLKRGHGDVWRDLTTELLNSPGAATPGVDLTRWRHRLAAHLVDGTRARDFHSQVRDFERYLATGGK